MDASFGWNGLGIIPQTEPVAVGEALQGETIHTIVQAGTQSRLSRLKNLEWGNILWIVFVHAGALLAPFCFTWSGLGICVLLHWMTGGLGICLCYHRLLTHRSFRVPKPIEYVLTVLGCMATQGGAMDWVGAHRIHHKFSDEPGDPHSPKDGHWWSHILWLFVQDAQNTGRHMWRRYVPDLFRDPIHRVLHHTHFL